MTRTRVAALLAGAVVALGALSVQLGQDVNFDLLNYHYYDGWAFLHGRLDRDLAPAGQQTYLAPLLHVVHYLGIAHLPPRLFGFLLGAAHGLNLPLVFLLGLAVLRRDEPARTAPIALLAAAAGCLGPAGVSLLGTTFGDNLVSIPALAALVLVLHGPDGSGPGGAWRAAAAGLLGGAAVGLKMTMAPYALALAAAASIAWAPLRAARRRLLLLAGGGVAGFLAFGGFWYWTLARRFGNPVFPLANAFFRSPYHAPYNFRDRRFAAVSAYDYLRPFVDTALGRTERFGEVAFRDLRLLLLLAAGALLLAAWALALARRRPDRGPRLTAPETALLAYWVVAYVLWAVVFYTYRYAAALEFTAPLLLIVLLRPLLPPGRRLVVAALLAVAIVGTSRVDSWGRRPWQSPWLALPVPPLGARPDSLVLVVGQPSAFAAPSFRPDARFVNLSAIDRMGAPAAWGPLVERTVAEHRGPILLLSNFEFSRADCDRRAAELGLVPTPRCEPVRNGALRFRLCELERAHGAGR